MRRQIPAFTEAELAHRYPGIDPELARRYEFCDKIMRDRPRREAAWYLIILSNDGMTVRAVDGVLVRSERGRSRSRDDLRAATAKFQQDVREAYRRGELDWWATSRFEELEGWDWDGTEPVRRFVLD
jgi:hypothetical protein